MSARILLCFIVATIAVGCAKTNSRSVDPQEVAQMKRRVLSHVVSRYYTAFFNTITFQGSAANMVRLHAYIRIEGEKATVHIPPFKGEYSDNIENYTLQKADGGELVVNFETTELKNTIKLRVDDLS